MNGTSMAAPHVSGALAVIKSAFPALPMNIITAIMFKTAKDLGEDGVDDVYGWGLVDLDKATSDQSAASLVVPGSSFYRSDNPVTMTISSTSAGGASSVSSLSKSKISLPHLFSGLKEKLNNIKVAGHLLEKYYYDQPLKNVVDIEVDNGIYANVKLAKQMLSLYKNKDLSLEKRLSLISNKYGDMRNIWGVNIYQDSCGDCLFSFFDNYGTKLLKPYFALDKKSQIFSFKLNNITVFSNKGFMGDVSDSELSYEQYGLNYQTNYRGLDIDIQVSNIKERDSFLSGDYKGAFALSSAGRTNQYGLSLQKGLNSKLDIYANYMLAVSSVKTKKDSLIRYLSDIQASSYRLGIMFRELFNSKDGLKFEYRQEPYISSGFMNLRYALSSKASKDLEDVGLSKSYYYKDDRIDVSSKGVKTYSLGYSRQLSKDLLLGLGIEFSHKKSAVQDIKQIATSLAVEYNF